MPGDGVCGSDAMLEQSAGMRHLRENTVNLQETFNNSAV